jgi:hypothetical protein
MIKHYPIFVLWNQCNFFLAITPPKISLLLVYIHGHGMSHINDIHVNVNGTIARAIGINICVLSYLMNCHSIYLLLFYFCVVIFRQQLDDQVKSYQVTSLQTCTLSLVIVGMLACAATDISLGLREHPIFTADYTLWQRNKFISSLYSLVQDLFSLL